MKYFVMLFIAAIALAYLYGGKSDQAFVVQSKVVVDVWGKASHRVHSVGDRTGQRFVFEVPAEDFEVVQVHNRLRPETVARWRDITDEVLPQRERKNFFDRVTGN